MKKSINSFLVAFVLVQSVFAAVGVESKGPAVRNLKEEEARLAALQEVSKDNRNAGAPSVAAALEATGVGAVEAASKGPVVRNIKDEEARLAALQEESNDDGNAEVTANVTEPAVVDTGAVEAGFKGPLKVNLAEEEARQDSAEESEDDSNAGVIAGVVAGTVVGAGAIGVGAIGTKKYIDNNFAKSGMGSDMQADAEVKETKKKDTPAKDVKKSDTSLKDLEKARKKAAMGDAHDKALNALESKKDLQEIGEAKKTLLRLKAKLYKFVGNDKKYQETMNKINARKAKGPSVVSQGASATKAAFQRRTVSQKGPQKGMIGQRASANADIDSLMRDLDKTLDKNEKDFKKFEQDAEAGKKEIQDKEARLKKAEGKLDTFKKEQLLTSEQENQKKKIAERNPESQKTVKEGGKPVYDPVPEKSKKTSLLEKFGSKKSKSIVISSPTLTGVSSGGVMTRVTDKASGDAAIDAMRKKNIDATGQKTSTDSSKVRKFVTPGETDASGKKLDARKNRRKGGRTPILGKALNTVRRR